MIGYVVQLVAVSCGLASSVVSCRLVSFRVDGWVVACVCVVRRLLSCRIFPNDPRLRFKGSDLSESLKKFEQRKLTLEEHMVFDWVFNCQPDVPSLGDLLIESLANLAKPPPIEQHSRSSS